MRNHILLSLIVICSLIIAGCGNGENGLDLGPGGCVTAPYDASIEVVSSASLTYSFGGGVAPFTDSFNLTILVTNVDGIPLNDVLLYIDFPWAVPSPVATVQLYDGATKKDAPMNVCTDVNGVYVLKVEYDGGCGTSYFGDFSVISGSVEAPPVRLTITGDECGA